MPLDPSIALRVRSPQIESPVNQLAKVMQLQGLQQQQQLGSMQMDTARREQEATNALNQAYAGAYGADGRVDRNKLFSTLASTGQGSKLHAIQKQFADQDSAATTADAAKFKLATERHDYYKKTLGALAQDPGLSKDVVLQAGQSLVQQGILPQELYDKTAATLPDDLQQLRQRLIQGVKTQMTPEQMFTVFAPKAEKFDTGAQIVTRDMNPNSPTYGQNTGGAPIKKEQSPDSIASQATARRGQDMVNQRAVDANTLKRQEIAGDAGGGGAVLGVPTPTVVPWANQSNPKDANKVKAQEISRGSKEIEKDTDAARKLEATARDAARFIELNKKIPTGGLVDRMSLTRWAQGMGAEYSELESITARLAPAMREPGSGSTSDFDGKQFERATVGVDKPKQTNENIAKAVVARAQQAQEYADFRQTYLEQNGTLQGADRYWKEYANANPIFDNAKPGAFELNPKRRAWSEHFKAAKPAKGEGGNAAAGAGLSPSEQAELEALRKQLGRR